MKKCNNKYYVTLKDVLDICENGVSVSELMGYDTDLIGALLAPHGTLFVNMVKGVVPFSLATVNNFFNSTFFAYFKNEAVFYFYGKPTLAEMNEAIDNWISNLIALTKQTYERYTTLIDFYTSTKANLMNKIETISESRVNDTPQNGGNFEADTYTSMYSKQHVQSDRDTPMERLAQIDRDFKNLYKDWLNELEPLFINSAVDFDENWEIIGNEEYWR